MSKHKIYYIGMEGFDIMLDEKNIAKASDFLDIPKDALLPKIVLNGRYELICQGYKGIRLYSDTVIRFISGDNIIEITGENLEIASIEENEIRITGKIKSTEFI